MAELRPFRALHYAPGLDLPSLICPPYDVIAAEEQRLLHERSPYNAVHLELPLGDGDRYQRAAAALRQWLAEGVLQREQSAAFYLYRQEFRHPGRAGGDRRHSRRALFARVRLEPWERGIIRPHEHTMSQPKEDRLRLLRATRANTSPIFALYRDAERRIAPILDEPGLQLSEPMADFIGPHGQRHTLQLIGDRQKQQALADAFADETLYVADGHHRYETALAYREERKSHAPQWTGEEPENFVLMALTAVHDPGLLVLPIHRLVRSARPPAEVLASLRRLFRLEIAPSLEGLLAAMAQRGSISTSFGMIADDPPHLYLLTPLDPAAIVQRMPPDYPPVCRSLDSAILQFAVLGQALGIDDAAIAHGELVGYSEDAAEALRQVREGSYYFAFLLNPASPAQILAVADAGERMPQKSTFFHPKVPAGLVFHLLED